MNRRLNSSELLRHYQTEAEDIRARRIDDKANKINTEKEHIKSLNNQLEFEKQNRIQSKILSVNAQKKDYERYITEKNSRQKSGDYRKKSSEVQGTFKIGGENREIRRKNKDDFENDLPINPTRNNQIPTTPNNNQSENNTNPNMPSNSNVVQINRNRNQGYNIISGEATDGKSEYENRKNLNDYNDNYSNNRNPITHANVNSNVKQQNTNNEINLPKINNRNLQTKANKSSYNPINHINNNNYYSYNPTPNEINNLENNDDSNRNKKNYNLLLFTEELSPKL